MKPKKKPRRIVLGEGYLMEVTYSGNEITGVGVGKVLSTDGFAYCNKNLSTDNVLNKRVRLVAEVLE